MPPHVTVLTINHKRLQPLDRSWQPKAAAWRLLRLKEVFEISRQKRMTIPTKSIGKKPKNVCFEKSGKQVLAHFQKSKWPVNLFSKWTLVIKSS